MVSRAAVIVRYITYKNGTIKAQMYVSDGIPLRCSSIKNSTLLCSRVESAQLNILLFSLADIE